MLKKVDPRLTFEGMHPGNAPYPFEIKSQLLEETNSTGSKDSPGGVRV